METILLALIAFRLVAEEPKATVESLTAELQASREEISHLKAQHDWCTTELNIWMRNPDVVQVRLTLMRETMKAEERKKAAAKAKPKATEQEPAQ